MGNLLAAYQPGLPWMGTSFMWATQPWSGHYELKSAVHVTAHWTQFTQPGWFYLANTGATTGGGSGFFAQGGTYATLVEKQDGSGAFSIVMEKIHHDRSKCVRPSLPEYDVAEEDVTFVLSGPAATLALSQGKLAYWLSTLRYNGVDSTVFEQQTPLTVTKGSADGTAQVTLTVPVDSIITVSSILTGPSKGLFPDPPAQTDFPIPYTDDFNAYPLHSEPSYFADQAGSWEVLDSGDASHGLAMRQMVPSKPICWAGDFAPVSVFGEIAWTDVSHSIDFNVDAQSSQGAAASLGARVTGTTRSHGVFVSVSTSNTWSLWYDLGQNKTALSGTTPVAIKPGDWHTLSLTVKGTAASATLDGIALFTNADISACDCPHGWTAVGTGWSYEYVWFDNYNIASATNNGVTCAKAAAGQCAVLEGASTEHDLNFRYSYDTTTSQVSLLSDPTLCLGVQGTDPNSGYPNVGLVACAGGDDGQQWSLQLNATTTQMASQYKGMGYCLDITNSATNSGANAELYTCNGGDNQKFVMDEDGRIINTGFTEPKKAVGACDPIAQ
jgi:galactosylceramidase